jgi:flavin-binding protein dodecin
MIELEEFNLKLKEKSANDNIRIKELEEKLERRNATINEMRRDFAVELLQLRLTGASETNKSDAANRAIERMKKDEEKIRTFELEKEQLAAEVAKKEQEVLALTKEIQMEANKFKKIKSDMQTNIYELEDKLRATNAELKQKNMLMTSRNAIIEQLNFTIGQRDENYLKLEARVATIMVSSYRGNW